MSEYYTKYTADTNREIAAINASATRYAADRNYASSVYAANTQRKIAASNQANALRLQQMKSTTDLEKQKSANEASVYKQYLANTATNYATNMNFKSRVVSAGLGTIGSLTSSLAHSYPLYAGGKP